MATLYNQSMLNDLVSSQNTEAIRQLCVLFVTVMLIMQEKGMWPDENEWKKLHARAIHLVDEEHTRQREEQLAAMSDNEREAYELFMSIFGGADG